MYTNSAAVLLTEKVDPQNSKKQKASPLLSSLSSFLFVNPFILTLLLPHALSPCLSSSACYIVVSHWRWIFFTWLVVWGWAALKMNEKTDLFSFLALQICSPSSLPLDRDCFDLGNGVCMYAHPFICPGCIAAKSKNTTQKVKKTEKERKMALLFAHALCLFYFLLFFSLLSSKNQDTEYIIQTSTDLKNESRVTDCQGRNKAGGLYSASASHAEQSNSS